MERAKLEEFVASAALLAAHLTRQCEESISSQRSTADDLRVRADAIGQRVLDANAELQLQARSAIRDALTEEIPAAVRSLRDTALQLQEMAARLQREQAATSLRMRVLGWKTMLSLALAATVMVGGSAYAAWKNMQRAEQTRVQAEVLDALAQVTITSCDGQPCLKLEDGIPRWSKNDEYVLLQRKAGALVQSSAP